MAIETQRLTKYYGKSRGIIELSLKIDQGEIFGFIGPNGAGKSTAIRTLLAFVYPTYGTAQIFGRDCIKDTAVIKRDIGYLPAEVNYYTDMRVGDLLAYSASFYRRDCRSRSAALCDLLELDTSRKIDELSFGNKKKVGIIQALQHKPSLLILDEPTSGLDPLMQNRFFELLRDENRKGTTIFFSSHILNEVQELCDRVAIIKEGSILRVDHIENLRVGQFKKVKVEFMQEVDAKTFGIPGVMNIETKGRIAEFLYGGEINNFIRDLAIRDIYNLWIEEPTLEQVFMNYYQKEENVK